MTQSFSVDPANQISAPASALRVLMLCPQYRPLIGGYEIAAERVSRALVVRGHHVEVITERRKKAWPKTDTTDGVVIRRLPCIYRKHVHVITSLFSFTGFLVLRGRRYNVWHVHQYGILTALAVALGQLLRRPVVLKLTSSGPMGIEAALSGKGIVPFFMRALHRRLDRVVATSEMIRDEAERFGIPQQRIAMIGNGIDTDTFCPIPEAEKQRLRRYFGLSGDLIVLYIGRLSAEKNPLGLLEAWEYMVHVSSRNLEIVYVGDGPQYQLLTEEVRRRGLSHSVRVLGARSDVLSWYQLSDLFVLPSHNEGLSNSLLEALSCGLPIVSTRVSGSIESVEVGRCGVLIDVGNMEGLAKEALALLEDDTRRRLYGEAARRYAVEKFSLANVAEAVEQVYRSVVRSQAV